MANGVATPMVPGLFGFPDVRASRLATRGDDGMSEEHSLRAPARRSQRLSEGRTMSSLVEAAKRNAEAAKTKPKPVRAARPEIDTTDLTPYRAAKKVAEAKPK